MTNADLTIHYNWALKSWAGPLRFHTELGHQKLGWSLETTGVDIPLLTLGAQELALLVMS